MASLRSNSPAKKPVHKVLIGPNSIRLQFRGHDNQSPRNIPTNTHYKAVFALHLADNLTDDGIKRLVNWITTLDPTVGLTVDGVYQTNSVGIVISGPYSVFSKLSGLPGVALIFEGTGGNLLSRPTSPESDAKPLPLRERLLRLVRFARRADREAVLG